jgi:hypothetical protein
VQRAGQIGIDFGQHTAYDCVKLQSPWTKRRGAKLKRRHSRKSNPIVLERLYMGEQLRGPRTQVVGIHIRAQTRGRMKGIGAQAQHVL